MAAKTNTGRKGKNRPARAKAGVARAEVACRRRATTQRARTFRRSDEGLAALLDANPDLAMLLESDCSQGCRHYRGWRRNGRRGPKVPGRGQGEGRWDAIDLALDRKGKRRVTSWLEAAYASVPPSRHWRDFPERIPPLEEAAGLRILLPEPVYRLADDEEAFARCHEQAEHDLALAFASPRRRRTKRTAKKRRADKTRQTDKRPANRRVLDGPVPF